MITGFWIWKNRLRDVLTKISDKVDIELNESLLDEIKYGLVGTSDEKGNWFEYQLGIVNLRLAIDNEDYDIVHFYIAGLDDEEIKIIENIGNSLI